MAGEQQSVIVSSDQKTNARGEQSAETIFLRDFGGVNLQSPREAIAENEFAWLEELIPVGPGNLVPVDGPSAPLQTITGETGAPTLTVSFVAASVGHSPTLQNVDTILAIWANSGNAWILSTGYVATKIASALFTSGETAATPWSNLGVLIVDPSAGYYDFSVTTQGVLTNLSGQIYDPVMTSTQPPANTNGTVPTLRVIDNTGPGTGATIGASASASSITLSAAGTGYVVGDVITLSGGTLTTSTAAPSSEINQPTTVTVLTIGTSGAVATFSITNAGYYQVSPTGTISTTGGSGSGFTVTAKYYVANPYIITPGYGYVTPIVQAYLSSAWTTYPMTLATSGTLLGTAIASYAGRAWIAIGRTVQFTDADSYSSFANSGSSFTITDSYLHKTITGLYAANNYLYIFGDDSVDILSNVTVVDGVAQFSRINASSSIGTSQPQSIFPYLRGLAFANSSGFYVISGATPEKVSDRLDNLLAATNLEQPIYGCQVVVNNILCMAFVLQFLDSFVSSPAQTRVVIAVLFRGRWWLTSQLPSSGIGLSSIISYPVSGLPTMFGWAGNAYYELLSTTNNNNWMLQTRLWDLGAPILNKQAIQAGLGIVLNGAASSGISVTVDNEYISVDTTIGSTTPVVGWVNNYNIGVTWSNNSGSTVPWVLVFSGYNFLHGSANIGGAKYLGLTVTGNTNTSQIRMLAIEQEKRARW